MRRWFTADLHLGHANIIGYCDRPFRDVDHMNAELVDRWNDLVTPDDEVWIVGDLAMGPIEHSLALVERLHGRLVLVSGNHDRCWDGHGANHERWIDRYHAAGISEIHHDAVPTVVSDDTGAVDVLVSHFPYVGDHTARDRFRHRRPIDTGAVLLHGHVHQTWKVSGRQINVGVDVWDYAPVPEAALSALARTAATHEVEM